MSEYNRWADVEADYRTYNARPVGSRSVVSKVQRIRAFKRDFPPPDGNALRHSVNERIQSSVIAVCWFGDKRVTYLHVSEHPKFGREQPW